MTAVKKIFISATIIFSILGFNPAFSQAPAISWSDYISSDAKSSCIAKREVNCLLKRMAELRSIGQGEFNYQANQDFINLVIYYSDTELANILLSLLRHMEKPDKDYLHFQEKFFEKKLQMQLLWVARQDKKAEEELKKLQEDFKEGGDYGAVWAILRRGDLDTAARIAELTIAWPRQVPDPLENTSGIMHCNAANPQS